MNKLVCILTFSLIFVFSVFAQSNVRGQYGLLDGRYSEISSTISERQDEIGEICSWGTRLESRHRYWLYELPLHVSFDTIVAELCEYLEHRYEFPNGDKGWDILWDRVEEYKPNTALPTSVKTMMKRLNRNVSVHIEEHKGSDKENTVPLGMIINYYDRSTETYTTLYFPCYS
jgi:hypothetical protein